MKVVHLTAEGFTNGFLDAMRHGTLTAFRARYRGAGALLVDDIHFLAAKKATQDEFLHTFNALVADGAPIILTSDQHPRQTWIEPFFYKTVHRTEDHVNRYWANHAPAQLIARQDADYLRAAAASLADLTFTFSVAVTS